MSEHIDNVSKRKQILKEVIQRLHAGESVEDLQAKFGEAIRGATAGEIADAERAMIGEGVSVSEIQRLCDLHVAVFRETLDEEPPPESLPGHPIFTFRMENEVTMRLLESMEETLEKWQSGDRDALISLRQQTENLGAIEKHYSRKENLLFPYLEKKGFEGPSSVMWGVDNEIREQIKEFKSILGQSEPDSAQAASSLSSMAQAIQDMIYKEERILFLEALQRMSESEWAEIRQQEEEIGYFNVTPRDTWKPDLKKEAPKTVQPSAYTEGLISLATGALTQEQINLMLTHIPVDVTFVDEHDRVRYFTQGRERIFDRSPAIIGRAVTKCHPPQSVHVVEELLKDFKSGAKDVEDFWINMGDKFIYIRYFAVRDEEGKYMGTLEFTQNVSAIRALEGEKRILS